MPSRSHHASRNPIAIRVGGLLAVILAGPAACLITLDREIACGDGYPDYEVGEECDPADPSSFAEACANGGQAACDPQTCQIIATREQCAYCGDGQVDEGEDCDGSDLAGQVCPSGLGTLRCHADCTLDDRSCVACNNGIRDEGEECDPGEPTIGSIGMSTQCTELATSAFPYTSGTALKCLSDCTLDRTGCGYCGNDVADYERAVNDAGSFKVTELCDGPQFNLDLLRLRSPSPLCDADDTLRVSVRCGDDCQSVIPRLEEDPCCVLKDGPCPLPGSTRKCCTELEYPDEPSGEVCHERNVDGELRSLCN